MNIIYLILILVLIIYLIFNYINNYINKNKNKNKNKKIDYIINPSNYKIINTTSKYDKFLTTRILLNNINANKNIIDIYKNIIDKINKNIVYGIKKKMMFID